MDRVPRRGLNFGDILGGGNGSNQVSPALTPSPAPTPSQSDPTGQTGGGLGNIGSVFDSLFSSPAPSSSDRSTVSTPSTASSISSSSSHSASLVPSSSSSSLPSSSAIPPSSSPLPTSPPASSPPANSSPSVFTSTSYTQLLPSSSTSPAAATDVPKSFLENKPLSGTIFGLSGLVALIAIVVFITTCVRRRSRNRLLNDVANISFDPTDVEDIAGTEKRYSGSRSGSRSGHGPAYISDQASSTGHGVTMVPDATYSRQDYGAASAAYMPNPYANHGQTYQQPRSISPNYAAAAGYGVYHSNSTRPHGHADVRAPALASKDPHPARMPAASPLPQHFGDDNAYGGVTSVDVMEDHTANRHQARNLHVANI